MDHKTLILNKTRQGLDVFRHYLGTRFLPDKKFKNPLYNDTRASCCIHMSKKSGIYMMKDFGNMEYSGDCFWLVSKLLNLDMKQDFVQILRRINEDMHLGLLFDSEYASSMGLKTGRTVSPQPSLTSRQETHDTEQEEPQPQPNIKVTYKEFSNDELKY